MTKSPACDQPSLLGPARPLEDPAPSQAISLRDLFAMYVSYVWNTLRRLGVHPSDLEDLTHDVFLQVNRHLGDYDPSRPVRPWLFGFAYRIASQDRRRARRRRETAIEPDLMPHGDADPEELAAQAETRRTVIEALQGIGLQRRAVFVLYELDGVPISEIARSLEIGANTAYSRLRVARTEFAAAVQRIRARPRRA
jgi:RNA polymerase sigma-70 factor (ECF subfamily)